MLIVSIKKLRISADFPVAKVEIKFLQIYVTPGFIKNLDNLTW